VNTADFLFPRDLEVTPTNLKKILFVGSCLSEAFVRTFRQTHPDVEWDYVLFNNASDLPHRSGDEIAGYDLQYIQIPIRSILTDAVVRIEDNEKSADPVDWISLGKQNISLMLKGAIGYNATGTLLTLVSNFVVPQGRIAASLDEQDSDQDLVRVIRELNSYLAQEIKKYPQTYLADVDVIANSLGKRFFLDDAIGFYTHSSVFYSDWAGQESFPHWTAPAPGRLEGIQDLGITYENRNNEFFEAIFRQIESIYRTVQQFDLVKIVIFDLDNTMWRGQLVENYQTGSRWPYSDGWPLGIWEAIHHLRRRGVLVSIASKNDESLVSSKWNDAVQPAFMKFGDFLQPKINWLPKAENILALLNELSLTPRSALFVDDNPVERESVRLSVPGIRVIGSDPFVVRRILLWAPEMQVATRTRESGQREAMLKRQVDREREKAAMSREDFLSSLQTRLSIFEVKDVTDSSFARIFELVNKTNQFNTNGERWVLESYREHFSRGGRVFGFSVVDRFTEYGIVGAVFVIESRIAQFVMSCRVLGMDIEIAVLSTLVNWMRTNREVETVYGSIAETESNTPCRDLYRRAGFRETGPGRYEFNESTFPRLGEHIAMNISMGSLPNS
jgi:FkbH-like protein